MSRGASASMRPTTIFCWLPPESCATIASGSRRPHVEALDHLARAAAIELAPSASVRWRPSATLSADRSSRARALRGGGLAGSRESPGAVARPACRRRQRGRRRRSISPLGNDAGDRVGQRRLAVALDPGDADDLARRAPRESRRRRSHRSPRAEGRALRAAGAGSSRARGERRQFAADHRARDLVDARRAGLVAARRPCRRASPSRAACTR